jgi:hypothetical protein
MKRKYSTYTSKELLQDDYFIRSMLYPSDESNRFWKSLITDRILQYDEFEQARTFLRMVEKPKRIMSNKEKSRLWTAIEVKNKKVLRMRIRRRNIYLGGVAVLLPALLISYVSFQLKKDRSPNDILAIANKPVAIPGSRDIQLIISDEMSYELEEKNADVVLNKEGKFQVNSALLNGETTETAKKTETAQEKEFSYNQLIIPKGRHSRLTLPDGTTMYINSGSRVIFPPVFKEKEREIFVEGEVYLEVAHNEKVPFIVRTEKMRVQVTGTSFNISAYKEDEEQSIVLVSGGVSVKTDNQKETCLSPNEMMTYKKNEKACFVSKVSVDHHIAWKEGYLFCENESLFSVLKRLSRYYGIEIEYDSKILPFAGNGKLDLKEDIERVLNGLSQIYPIAYIQDGKNIRIMKKNGKLLNKMPMEKY